MKQKKYIEKQGEEKPFNLVGEANLKGGDYWIIEEEIETNEEKVIILLTEIRDLLNK